ncbi:LysR family transcriptional regulator [Sneathiella sp. P13V-1]|uniref:LysR substrate-binding domain-containing protein n=1 Tax=Sneathiella sp. P13V-1 TaxID=2697366 RepID=UPI00187B8269|nr:LysR substrate-binding domain-containing protein [Sneathiella sp. P13V-1]MBE7637391.1 LysR family transcriptional regulator [Sneathiella sp. P13V-1]
MKRELPPLNQLKSFEAAARHQSFAAAALELHVTPAAVSRLVKSLEEYLEVPLFNRGASHVTLTSHGQKYLGRITGALDEIAVATSEIRGEWERKLTIAAFPSVAQRWLIPVWAEFSKRYPNMKIEVRNTMTPPGHGADGIDASIRVVPPNDTTLIWEKIHNDTLFPVCSPSYLKQCVNGRYTRIHCRTRNYDWGNWYEHAKIPKPQSQHIADMEFDSLLSAIEAAIQGIGVTVAIRSVVEPELNSGALVPAFPNISPIPCPFYLTYPQFRANHPTLTAFMEFVTKK